MDPIPEWARRARFSWRYDGRERPHFAEVPGPGQESVWDYPRPPRLEEDTRRVVVRAGDVLVAESTRALRLLETASPPTFYLPVADVDLTRLQSAGGGSHCEWKGQARYLDVLTDEGTLEGAAWTYDDPFPPYQAMAGALSFYPARLECFVDGERVLPQPGGFYGGWVTSEIVGPIKGDPGTGGW